MLISLLLIQQRLTDRNLKFLNMAQKRAKSTSHHGKKKKVELNICEAKPLCNPNKKEEPNDDPSRIEIKKEVDDQKEEIITHPSFDNIFILVDSIFICTAWSP